MSYQEQLNKYFDKRYPQYPRKTGTDVWVEGEFYDDRGGCPTCGDFTSASLKFWYIPKSPQNAYMTHIDEPVEAFAELLKGILEA